MLGLSNDDATLLEYHKHKECGGWGGRVDATLCVAVLMVVCVVLCALGWEGG